jgi:hypothetical protein
MNERGCNSRSPAILALLVLMPLAAAATAQQVWPGPIPSSGAPAAPDTLVARFVWRDGPEPAPVALRVVPRSATLGQVVAVVIDGAAGATLPPVDALQVDVDWLVPVPQPTAEDGVLAAVAALPAPDGPQLVSSWRVYALGVWRAAWGDRPPGEAVTVQGRLDGSEPIMPVRDPRLPGGLPRWVVWLAALVVLAVLGWLAWRRLRRRRGSLPQATDQPLAAPAWLQAALDLRELEASGATGRAFLDRLAAILRRYLQDRFHLPAVEMTVAELATAARAAGWRDEQVADFLAILAACDRLRYAPPEISMLACRDCLATALACIERVRILPVWSPVTATQLAAATAAWRDLCGGQRDTHAVGAGGGAC